MNLLFEKPPDHVVVNGEHVPIDTDFRNGIRIISAFEDQELTDAEKFHVLIHNLYDQPVEDLREAYEKGVEFLNCNVEDTTDNGTGFRLYSFTKDSNLIYAAFRQIHGIDLTTAEMHWWDILCIISGSIRVRNRIW